MATLASDYGGATEAWKYVSPHGQPNGDEGIVIVPHVLRVSFISLIDRRGPVQ